VTAIDIREFDESEADAVTQLLHAAYAELGAAGLNFTAVDQSVATTMHRASAGHCLVAWDGDEPIATITMSMPASATLRRMFPQADRDDVAWLNQLAVSQQARGRGLARELWQRTEAWARSQAATVIGVDTAIPATHLVDLYRGWGFEPAGSIHWDGKTYDSAVLLKQLS
jgi:GNAT superfamily N-acetyltransferase